MRFKWSKILDRSVKPNSPVMPIQVRGLVNRHQPDNFSRLLDIPATIENSSMAITGVHLIKWPTGKWRTQGTIIKCMDKGETITWALVTSSRTRYLPLVRDTRDTWVIREITECRFPTHRLPPFMGKMINTVARSHRWSSLSRTGIQTAWWVRPV